MPKTHLIRRTCSAASRDWLLNKIKLTSASLHSLQQLSTSNFTTLASFFNACAPRTTSSNLSQLAGFATPVCRLPKARPN